MAGTFGPAVDPDVVRRHIRRRVRAAVDAPGDSAPGLRRECGDVAARCRDAVGVSPCVLRRCDRRAGVERAVTSTTRCEHVCELAQGGARWTWPRAGLGDGRITGRMACARLC